jgi:2,4-dienoyl-CoA reductase-like NADH-dependent reductase (Old Yellow Enzyme family)/thioredoxin reductase
MMKLFEPIKIGEMELRNRFVAAATSTRLASPEGYATRGLIDYWSARAKGGCGLVIVEAACVDIKTSRIERNQVGAYTDECHVGLCELAESIQMHGAKAALQILHAGRQTTAFANYGNTPIAPSPIPCKYMSENIGQINKTKEISLAEIEEVINAHADAAGRVKAAGFNAIEIHGAHGYLIASFLSPYTNKRKDRYGGSLENRARFALEIVERVREKVGKNFPIIFRITASECMGEEGITPKEAKVTAKWLEDASVDCLHVSASNYETVEWQCPVMYQPYGILIDFAAEIKKEVNVPVIAVGSITPELAIKTVEEGKADMVAISRGLIADPDFPNKIAENRLEDIRPCLRCEEGCLLGEALERPVRCDVNFLAGRESYIDTRPAVKSLEVTVIGGGPGGMEAARVAALRGHNVTLYDENNKLGGLLIPAGIPPFKNDIRLLNKYLEIQLKKLGVKVKLGKKVEPSDLKAKKPDAIIVAIGSKPSCPDIKGFNKGIVVDPIDLLLNKRKVGQTVIVSGGGFIGCEVAAYLGQQKKKVFLTTRRAENQIAGEMEYAVRKVLRGMLKESNVEIRPEVTLSEVLDNGATFLDKKLNKLTIRADNIIPCTGFTPKKEEAKAFKGIAPRFYAVGDCVEVRRVGPAIHEGYFAAYNL